METAQCPGCDVQSSHCGTIMITLRNARSSTCCRRRIGLPRPLDSGWLSIAASRSSVGTDAASTPKESDEPPPHNVMVPKRNTLVSFHNHIARRRAEGCPLGAGIAAGTQGAWLHRQSDSPGPSPDRMAPHTGRPVAAEAAMATTSPLVDRSSGHLVSASMAAALRVKPRGLLMSA